MMIHGGYDGNLALKDCFIFDLGMFLVQFVSALKIWNLHQQAY